MAPPFFNENLRPFFILQPGLAGLDSLIYAVRVTVRHTGDRIGV
jgi:hypothetical protein